MKYFFSFFSDLDLTLNKNEAETLPNDVVTEANVSLQCREESTLNDFPSDLFTG